MNEFFKAKAISSLEKCFSDGDITRTHALSEDTVLQNERYAFQVAYVYEHPKNIDGIPAFVTVESPIAERISVSIVESVPVRLPVYRNTPAEDLDNYLRTTPGLYPDLLLPYEEKGRLSLLPHELSSLWIDVDASREPMEPGTYPIDIIFTSEAKEGEAAEEFGRVTFTLTVLPAMLPKQKTLVTQWFHTDCLSSYYGTPVFSEEYWRIVENYMFNLAKNGINLVLTPTHTPPLDTAIGHERPTVQLIDVTYKNGAYSFDLSKLGRWVDIAERAGIENFEIAHLFTQWGAKSAPKIMATVYDENGNAEYKRIFGWDTVATSVEYTTFLRAYLTELLTYMKSRGKDKNCYFHISDEPWFGEQLECYIAAKNTIADILEGYTIMDAVSHYEIYESGALATPIPASNSIEEFLAHNVPNLWTYYCCAQPKDVSNRFLAMPSDRNRIIGIQMYKHNIVGFLHWGYNFYYSRRSFYPINPYYISDGDFFSPAGDCYSVYPAPNGDAYDSLRIRVFYHALQDIRAMQLAEELCGRDAVMNAIEGELAENEKITFAYYPHGEKDGTSVGITYVHKVRAAVNALIASKI